MGPPPSGSGNPYLVFVLDVVRATSMGPPPSGSGNRAYHRVSILGGQDFNGATAFRQWKLKINRIFMIY